ncbi:MAG: hypothetical protein WC581_01735 [Thermodesulfovibrionales bacterium]
MKDSFFAVIAGIFSIIGGILALTSQSSIPLWSTIVLLMGTVIIASRPKFIVQRFNAIADSTFGKIFKNPDVEKEFVTKLSNLSRQLSPSGKDALKEVIALLPPPMPVDFARSFKEYCEKCSVMVSHSDGEIWTVQTPYDVRGDVNYFEKYLDETIDYLTSDGRIRLYRRLVIVDKNSFAIEWEKLETFLKKLFEKGNVLQRKPSYDNIEICFVRKDFAEKLFYSNLDIHITSRNNYAIAFLLSEPDNVGPSSWESSIHVWVHQNVFSNYATLRNAYNILWNRGEKEAGEIRFRAAYDNKGQNYQIIQDGLIVETKKIMEQFQ